MTDHVEPDAANEASPPSPSSGRRLAPALAAVVALTVAGGWAYDHRDEYRVAYRQLFDASGGCPSGGCSLAASAPSLCCHLESGCGAPPALTALIPVEAPKPPVVLSEGDAAVTAPTSL